MNNRKILSIFTNKLFVVANDNFSVVGAWSLTKNTYVLWRTSDFNIFQLLLCTRYQYRHEFSRVLSLGRKKTPAAYIWGRPSLLTSWLPGAKELWGDTGPNRLPSLAALIPREVEQTYWPRLVSCVMSLKVTKTMAQKTQVWRETVFFEGGIWQGCVIPRTDQQTQQTSGQGNASCQHVHLRVKKLTDIFQKTDHMIRTMLSPKVS